MSSDKGAGGKKGGIDLPDPEQLIKFQEQANRRAGRQTSRFNQFDQFTPFGSTEFFGRPGSKDFRQVTSLDPAEQALLEQGQAARQAQFGANQDLFGQPLGGTDGGAVEDATFQRGQNLLQPGFEEAQSRLENQLIQRGIPRNSEAFTTELDRLSRQQGGALENLALSSVGAGRQEQSRALQADLARRGAVLQGGQPNIPGFGGGPGIGISAPNIGDAFGLSLQNQGLAGQGKAAGKGGLTQLGTAGILAGAGKGAPAAGLGLATLGGGGAGKA